MWGHSAHYAGVFVVDLSLDNAFSKSLVIGGRRDKRLQRCRRIERNVQHSYRPENFTLAKTIERSFSNSLQRQSDHYETYVTVFGVSARIILEWNLQGLLY